VEAGTEGFSPVKMRNKIALRVVQNSEIAGERPRARGERAAAC
jgi:hypothetical protein